jgi:hypothetical protein
MSIIPAFLEKLFVRQAQVLGWQWIPDDHVVDAQLRPVPAEPAFAANQDYVVLRLAEMYLKTIRVLWRERYPVVHAFVAHGDTKVQRGVTTVAGPGQLKDLGTPNLDRLVGLAYRLAGPIVYDGQDIELLAGLYAVPAHDAAKPLVDTLSQLSGVVPSLAHVGAVAGALKTGIEGLLGLEDTKLTLGVRDVLRPSGAGGGRVARPGFLVAVNAPQASLDAAQLWIKEGRLYAGANPIAARPFDAHDMMLFELHRGPSRAQVFATLPVLAERVKEFDAILRDAPAEELPKKINPAYRVFESDLRGIQDLTDPDKAAIRAMVANDLKQRVKEIQSGGLLEVRDVAGKQIETTLRSFSARELSEPPAGVPLPVRAEGEPLFA